MASFSNSDTRNGSLADSSTYLTTLSQAAAFQSGTRPKAVAVVNALLQAERFAKQQKLTYSFESLLGRWQLCFATQTRKARHRGGIVLGKGFYMPKFAPAYISFTAQAQLGDSGEGEISNQVQLGTLLLRLTGPCQYQNKKNLLAFDFTQMRISVFNYQVYSGNIRGGKAQAEDFYHQAIAKLPFFAFFLVTAEFIAARGRGGGLAIWTRADPES